MAEIARFAWVMDEMAPRSSELWDREILRTERFVALPSAGSLVAGWTLVIPRRRMLNLGHADATDRSDLAIVIKRIASALSTTGQRVYCFEHGSGWMGSATGCGVDQAHLHIVPLPFDLLAAAAARNDGVVEWQTPTANISALETLPQHGEYVALWSATECQFMIGHVRRPISQWIRRVIADELGIANEWDYRNHPQTDKVRQTLEILTPLRTMSAR